MSVTALDLSVVTIESLVAQDISAYSLRHPRGASTQPATGAGDALPTEQPTAVSPLVLPAAAATSAPTPAPVAAPAHPHRAPSGRRLVQVH